MRLTVAEGFGSRQGPVQAGMRPRFSLGCAQRKAAAPGGKERRLGAKRRFTPYLLKTGVERVGAVENRRLSAGCAVLSSS